MMDILKDYVWETDQAELDDQLETGYTIIYADVSLSVIYGELLQYFNDDIDQQVKDLFGYYGLHNLLLIDGIYYWLMLA